MTLYHNITDVMLYAVKRTTNFGRYFNEIVLFYGLQSILPQKKQTTFSKSLFQKS